MYLFPTPLLATGLAVFLLIACASLDTHTPTTSSAVVETKGGRTLIQPPTSGETGKPVPCWVERPKCNQTPEFVYFTGSIKRAGGWPSQKLKRAAVKDAISQLAEYLETAIESEIWQETICGSSRCEHEAGKRVVATALLGIRGRDFVVTDEYSDQEWLHVRIRIPHVFLEERLKQAVQKP